MKKFLVSTAVLAALSAPAFAAGTAETSQSLLSGLLANATDLAASLSNVAENLNSVNGSIDVTTSRAFDGLASGIGALGGTDAVPFGSFSQVNASVFARDLPASLLSVLDPLTLTLGDLSTTAIGAMQSGSITGTVNASGIVDRVSTAASGSTTDASAMAEAYGGIANTVAFQNIAVNSGDIDGSVGLILADVNSNIGKIGTTAIGAMGSGSLTATITGNMGGVASSTSNIIDSLIGTP